MAVSIASTQYFADWINSVDTVFDVRAKSSKSWITATGEVVGTGESRIVGQGTITALRPIIPSITLPSTSAGLDNQTARWTVTLHRTNVKNPVFTVLDDFPLNVSFEPATTWAAIAIAKHGKQPLRDTSTYTKIETQNQINIAVGTLNDAAATPGGPKGRVLLSVAPILAAAPIAVGDNDPRVNAPLGIFNVKASPYNATGDGSTDDKVAIQAALTAAGLVGGTVYFPATANGYLTSDGLAMPANVTLMGDGYGSMIKCPANGWNVLTSGASVGYGILNAKNVSKVRITNLRIYGTKTAPIDVPNDGGFPRSAHTPKLIYLEGTGGASVADGVMIDHCWLENSAWEGIWEGGSIDSTLHVQINNNQFTNIDGPSALTGNFERATIEDNIFQDCQSALGTTGRHVVIIGNQIYGAISQGIGIGEIGTDGFVEVSGNVIRISPTSAASWGGIQVITTTTTGQINITGNEVYVVDSLGSASGAGIRVLGGGASVDINNNSVQGNGALVGIAATLGSVVGTSYVSVRGNTVRLTSESATPNQSRGISLTNTTGTLIAQSVGNKVLGMTRANGNYAYDYRTAGGSITVVMEGDFKTNGDMQIGTATYATSETDNVPLFLSSDFTGNDAHVGRAMLGILRFRPTQSITIAGGIVTIAGLNTGNGLPYRQTRIILDTEGGGATDDLDTINGTQDGDVLILGSVNSGHDVTIKNGTGNIFIGSDFTLATTRDKLMLLSDGTNLYQIGRSTN